MPLPVGTEELLNIQNETIKELRLVIEVMAKVNRGLNEDNAKLSRIAASPVMFMPPTEDMK